ncbi:MAG: DUF4031 domain-containing protein [Dermabacter sp.]|nr:DUF4031 domain-containing protein [Dermabacter sp.]
MWADEPRWRNHGTVWGHLISDTSLEELHAAAASLGLHPRSFDLDHYDFPYESLGALRDAGVSFVSGRDLARILGASGLRVPLRERPAARRRRTDEALAALGAERVIVVEAVPGTPSLRIVIDDLVWGQIGHADPLPAGASPSAFHPEAGTAGTAPIAHVRCGREPDAEPWVSVSAAPGAASALARRAGWALLEHLDAAANGQGDTGFVGQVLARVQAPAHAQAQAQAPA